MNRKLKPSHSRLASGICILFFAGALSAQAVVTNNTSSVAESSPEQSSADSAKVSSAVVGVEIASFAELNVVATNSDAVFVYLPGKTGSSTGAAPVAPVKAAVDQLKASDLKIAVFTLNGDAPEYAQIGEQMELPAVIAMVKGRGMTPVSGEITKDKLVRAIASASSAGGCGCGPSGCN